MRDEKPPSAAALWPEIQRAGVGLEGIAHRTPIITSRTLDRRTGCTVRLKCENLQRAGAFKFRGAYTAISRLSDAERAAGVVTHSSGNHAQAVALVGKLLEVQTTIVMPTNAPATKRAATEAYGATVVEYDPATTDRAALAQQIAGRQGSVLIPPFDHADVIAGQGTVALELIEDCGPLDALLVPVGGGGLLSGSAIAARHLSPRCRVIGVEPELADDATRSFYSGTLQSVHNPPTIADGTRVSSLGHLNFALIRETVDAMCTVSEDAIKRAVRFLLFRIKLLVEPSGALGVAALLSHAVDVQGRVGVVLSGGNVDAATLAAILASDAE
ncbi:MAG: pyridoxal-phosphate dependent enzyme [Acidobacteriota bacterium]|nr:pyridoxal-phosphate dependent enzyme [Acidobacteriota bacterium]